MDIAIELLMAFLGSLGFAMLFQVRGKKLLLASLGGLISWAVYLMMGPYSVQDVPKYFVASVVVTIYAEILARLVKCPTTTFLVTGAVPLIPGGSLYRAMSCFMAQDYAAFSDQAFYTLVLAMSIAVGMLFPMSVFQLIRRTRELLAKRNAKKT